MAGDRRPRHAQQVAAERRALTRQLTCRSGLRRWQTARSRRRARRTASPTDQRDLIDGTFCVVRRSIRYRLFCIFALCVRGWASFAARGAVLRATHPNLVSSISPSCWCLPACVAHDTGFYRSAATSFFVRSCSRLLVARRYSCLWVVGVMGARWCVTRATPSCGVCVGGGTSFARARFARWGEGPCDV